MVRRVITGNSVDGNSYFVSDDEIAGMTLWESSPGDPLGSANGAPHAVLPTTAPGLEPPPGGSRCVFATIPPWAIMRPNLERGDYPGLDADGFHRTETVDYIMMVSGEITLVLDQGETTVRAGDLVVQRNTMHSWRNNGHGPASFWATMVSVKPTAP